MRVAQLPPKARDLSGLPLLRMRNILPPKGESMAVRLQKLESIGVPTLEQPEQFVPTLLQLEAELGTCHAALIGFAGMAGLDLKQTKQEVERFEGIYAGFQRQATSPQFNISALFAFLRPKLIFDLPFRNKPLKGLSFFNGLKALEENVRGGNRQVGNCVVCSSIFGLFSLRGDQLAGEAKSIDSEHNHAYVLTGDGPVLYEMLRPDLYYGSDLEKTYGQAIPWQQFFIPTGFMDQYQVATNINKADIDIKVQDPSHRKELGDALAGALGSTGIHKFIVEKGTSLMRSSAFTFISTLFSLQAQDIFYFKLWDRMDGREKGRLRNAFAVAEAINPFTFELYPCWNKALENMRIPEASNYQIAVNRVVIDSDGLPEVG